MTSIKISKQGKYYLSKDNTRLCEDCSFIEKINEGLYALKIIENTSITWQFYNCNTNQIDLTLRDSRLISDGFKEDNITFDRVTCFSVYNKNTLKEILSIDKNEDKYNFHYIGNGYSVYENNIYNGSSRIGFINDFPILYEDVENKHKIIKIEDKTLFYINRDDYGLRHKNFTIFKNAIPEKFDKLYVVNKNLKNNKIFFFKNGTTYLVYSDDELIYKGIINDENGENIFDYANCEMINFSNGNDHFIITNNHTINGPFKVKDFEFNRIFKFTAYSLYYKDKSIIKYNHNNHLISIEDSPFEFKLHLNVNTDVLFKGGNEHAKLSIGDEEYFYNDLTDSFTKLENSIEIIPYIFSDKIYYLDNDLTEKCIKPDFDIRDLTISDYTYYKNKLYLIIKEEEVPEPNGKYIIYDVLNNTILKTFDSFIEFTSHQEFFLNNIKYHSSSFIYILDENGSKIVKLPFKTKGINIMDGVIKFSGMFNEKSISLLLGEPIYNKEL
jgi:hypothetical protein